MKELPNVLSFVEQLKPYATDAEAYGRLSADFQDLVEACAWFLSVMKENEGKLLQWAELENFANRH